MGCDIHTWIEVQQSYGWELFAEVQVGRDYRLFAALAGVRRDDQPPPLIPPRGLPVGSSSRVRSDLRHCGGHTPTWMTFYDLSKVYDAFRERRDDDGTHYGNADMERLLLCLEAMEESGDTTRVVFWFDN